MKMSQSHIRLRNEIKENTIQAVLDLKQKRKKELKRRKSINNGVIPKVILSTVFIVIICFSFIKIIPFSASSENEIYKSSFQDNLGKKVASVISSNIPEKSRISVLLLFHSRNKRYKPMAETLTEELNYKGHIVRASWPLDNKLIDEDEYEKYVNSSILNNLNSDALTIISPGGVEYVARCPALIDFLEAGKKLIVMGNCPRNSGFVKLAEQGDCILISRKKGWLKEVEKEELSIEDFVSEDYVILGQI